MKLSILFTAVALVFNAISSAQQVYKIKTDSLLVTNDSCLAELNLENSTRNIKGFLYNKGNGRTEFRKGMIKINDSVYVFGNDTLKINQGLPWKQGGNSFGNTGIFGTTDNNHVDFYSNNVSRGRLTKTGNWLLGTSTDLGQKLQVNGNATFATNIAVNGTNPTVTINGDNNSYYPALNIISATGTSSIQAYVGLVYGVPASQTHRFHIGGTTILAIGTTGVKVTDNKLLNPGWTNAMSGLSFQWIDRGGLVYDTTNQLLRVNQLNPKQNNSSSGSGYFNKVNTSVLFERTTTNATATALWVNSITNASGYQIADSSAFTATVQLTAIKSDGTEMVYGVRHIAFRKMGGTLTKISESDIVATVAEGSLSGISWTTGVVSGVHLGITVTGKASTIIKWRVEIDINDIRL